MEKNYLVLIYIPYDYVRKCLDALTSLDAGHIGAYTSVSSVTPSMGYWLPEPGSHAYDGEVGKMSMTPEAIIHVFVKGDKLKETVDLVKKVHPFEEPVVYAMELTDTGLGITG